MYRLQTEKKYWKTCSLGVISFSRGPREYILEKSGQNLIKTLMKFLDFLIDEVVFLLYNERGCLI